MLESIGARIILLSACGILKAASDASKSKNRIDADRFHSRWDYSLDNREQQNLAVSV